MDLDQDLERLDLQEERLQFANFDAETAWTVGTHLREAAAKRQWAVAVEIQLNGHTVFLTTMLGTGPDNLDWIRRKRNVVQRFERSSYAFGLQLKKEQKTLQEKFGLDERDYAPYGGCFPVRTSAGLIGTIGVSGLPDRTDHELIVEVLAEMLEVRLEEVALAVY